MVAVRKKTGFLSRVENVNPHVYNGNENDYMVFGQFQIWIAKPGDKYKHYDAHCKSNGHNQSSQPNSVGVFLVVNSHFYACFALF
jgi:hypothetical protein